MSAINWLINNSTVTETEPAEFDGQLVSTKTYTFDGTISKAMKREITDMTTTYRGGAKTSTYNMTDDSRSYAFKFGATKGTSLHLMFIATEYIIHESETTEVTEATAPESVEVVSADVQVELTPMQRTPDEIESLKANWQADPCWDIEDTDGFEAHRFELLAFSNAHKQACNDTELDRQLARANDMKIDIHVLKVIERLEARIKELETVIEGLEETTSHLRLQDIVRHYAK